MPKKMMLQQGLPLRRWMRRAHLWHQTNALGDFVARKDTCFDFLTRLSFNDVEQFALFKRQLPAMLKEYRGEEWVLAWAGYIAYIERDYAAACAWFLKAAEMNPENLDNWMDLAFALRHAGHTSTSTGIFFNFDYVIHYVRTFGMPRGGLRGLKGFVRKIVRAGGERE